MYKFMKSAVLADVARYLMKHGMRQVDAAKKLGLTQPALSQYKNRQRGKTRIPRSAEYLAKVKEVAEVIAKNKFTPAKSREIIERIKLM